MLCTRLSVCTDKSLIKSVRANIYIKALKGGLFWGGRDLACILKFENIKVSRLCIPNHEIS